jgi:hypothetical protein
MTCLTKSWHFYWGRLGYESNALSHQRQDVARNIQGYAPEEPAGTATPEPPERTGIEIAASQKPMG